MFCLLTNICALVLAVVVDTLEIRECLDYVEIITEIYNEIF